VDQVDDDRVCRNAGALVAARAIYGDWPGAAGGHDHAA
jgi:hypothetical protein